MEINWVPRLCSRASKDRGESGQVGIEGTGRDTGFFETLTRVHKQQITEAIISNDISRIEWNIKFRA